MKEIIYEKSVEIQGITPLLHHRPNNLGGPEGVKGKDHDYSNEWRDTIYLGMDHQTVIIPNNMMEACLRDGSKGLKLGKNFLSRLVPSSTEVVEFEIPLVYEGQIITLDMVEANQWLNTSNVVIGGKRVIRIRACIPIGWTAKFNLRVFNRLITEDVMQQVISNAGISAGLMDWRPGAPKPGKFGQFQLINWQEVKRTKKAA